MQEKKFEEFNNSLIVIRTQKLQQQQIPLQVHDRQQSQLQRPSEIELKLPLSTTDVGKENTPSDESNISGRILAGSKLAESTKKARSAVSPDSTRGANPEVSFQLQCNGELRDLAHFSQAAAPRWLLESRKRCDSLAACLWFACAERCYDGGARPNTWPNAEGKTARGGGGGGGSGARQRRASETSAGAVFSGRGGRAGSVTAGRDGLAAALQEFDESGTVQVTAPSGGSMVVAVAKQVFFLNHISQK